MADSPDDRNVRGKEEQQPALPPRSVEAADDSEPVDADFRVIQETIGRLLRQEMRVVRQEIRAEIYSGLLPHERTLEAYERISPGAARMIFTNFDEQGKHRRAIELYTITWGNYRSFAGLVRGLIVTLAFLLVSYLLIKGGHGVEGTVLGTLDLIGLVAVFVYGTQVVRDERVRKAKIMMGQNDEDEAAPRLPS